MTEPHVAVLVLNRNMKDMTERLIGQIRKTKVKYSLVSLEAASDPDKMVQDFDLQIRFAENRRWAWSFAEGMAAALISQQNYHKGQLDQSREAYNHNSTSRKSIVDPITHFWLLCNDAQLDSTNDTLARLLDWMPEDACQIHPFQTTHPVGSPQGFQPKLISSGKMVDGALELPLYHNVAFVEFVCPLITRSFYDQCLAKFNKPPVNPAFAFGWGVDYEMAYMGHELGLKSYICDAVGMTHHPGTTHENHILTKVEDNTRMRIRARNDMLDVLEEQYGRDWGGVFEAAARKAGVDPKAFLEWSAFDRGLSARSERVSEA